MSDDLSLEEIDVLRSDARLSQRRLHALATATEPPAAVPARRAATPARVAAALEALRRGWPIGLDASDRDDPVFRHALRRAVLDTPDTHRVVLNTWLSGYLGVIDAAPDGAPPIARAAVDLEDQKHWRFRTNSQEWPEPRVIFPGSEWHLAERSEGGRVAYFAARIGGDEEAAYEIVMQTMEHDFDPSFADWDCDPSPLVFLPIRSADTQGRDRFASALAEILAAISGGRADQSEILQANLPRRPGCSDIYRLSAGTRFVGSVDASARYVIVDGIVEDDATIADLIGYLVHHGASVAGMAAVIWDENRVTF